MAPKPTPRPHALEAPILNASWCLLKSFRKIIFERIFHDKKVDI